MTKSIQPTQLDRVRNFVVVHGMAGTTLAAISITLGISETAASARLRDLRAEGYSVDKVIGRTPGGKKTIKYVVSQFAVNAPRTASKGSLTAPAKDVSLAALRKVAEAALVPIYGTNPGLPGGRGLIVDAIAKYLAA